MLIKGTTKIACHFLANDVSQNFMTSWQAFQNPAFYVGYNLSILLTSTKFSQNLRKYNYETIS